MRWLRLDQGEIRRDRSRNLLTILAPLINNRRRANRRDGQFQGVPLDHRDFVVETRNRRRYRKRHHVAGNRSRRIGDHHVVIPRVPCLKISQEQGGGCGPLNQSP